MAFREANLGRLVKFNSAASSDFIDAYEQHWENKIAAKNAEPKHKTFAPSSFRCPRNPDGQYSMPLAVLPQKDAVHTESLLELYTPSAATAVQDASVFSEVH